jgi:hypothetical protein
MSKKIQFFPSGNNSEEIAQDLENLLQQWLKKPEPTHKSPNKGIEVVRVEISNPTRATSVEQCVSYACSEIRDGIRFAGGKIWDGTHVLIGASEEK